MSDYISREAFVEHYRKLLCEDCDRRKGMKNGKLKFCYEIGGAPCRACSVDDMLGCVEDFPAADVREVRRGKWRFDDFDGDYQCPFCRIYQRKASNYCPDCGADLRRGIE